MVVLLTWTTYFAVICCCFILKFPDDHGGLCGQTDTIQDQLKDRLTVLFKLVWNSLCIPGLRWTVATTHHSPPSASRVMPLQTYITRLARFQILKLFLKIIWTWKYKYIGQIWTESTFHSPTLFHNLLLFLALKILFLYYFREFSQISHFKKCKVFNLNKGIINCL